MHDHGCSRSRLRADLNLCNARLAEENDYRNDYPDEDEPDSDNNKVEFRDSQRAAWSSDESDGMEGDSDGSDGMYADSEDDY